MENIQVNELIITCESCGTVKRFAVTDEADSKRIFDNFRCENNCGRNLYSFITLGTVIPSPPLIFEEEEKKIIRNEELVENELIIH